MDKMADAVRRRNERSREWRRTGQALCELCGHRAKRRLGEVADDNGAEEVQNEFEAMLKGKTIMVAQCVFEFRKMSDEVIGRVVDLRGGKAQKSEQPRKVVCKAQEGTAKARMGVVLVATSLSTITPQPRPK
jgi:hypothetical protein